jgi:hypothetical protein
VATLPRITSLPYPEPDKRRRINHTDTSMPNVASDGGRLRTKRMMADEGQNGIGHNGHAFVSCMISLFGIMGLILKRASS